VDGRVRPDGYVLIWMPEHPHASVDGYVLEHVLVASRALGKPLPAGAHVHHVNGDRGDNRAQNLVVCQDTAYHGLLHQRTRALQECGHADWRRCVHCGDWDAPDAMYLAPTGNYACHRECNARYQRELRAA
jgi:hypothetical protein